MENKISKSIGVLFKAKKYHILKLLKLCYSIIHTYLNYANIAWANTNKTKL